MKSPFPGMDPYLKKSWRDGLIDRIYVNGAYDTIDYLVPPIPPLDVETAARARELVAQREST